MAILYYNSEDGGQTNVPVEVVGSVDRGDKELYIISGKGLISPSTIDGYGVLIVKIETVTAKPLAEIIQLRS